MDGTPCEPGKLDVCVDGICRVSYAPAPSRLAGDCYARCLPAPAGPSGCQKLSGFLSSQNGMRSLQMSPDHLNFASENTNLMRETLDG